MRTTKKQNWNEGWILMFFSNVLSIKLYKKQYSGIQYIHQKVNNKNLKWWSEEYKCVRTLCIVHPYQCNSPWSPPLPVSQIPTYDKVKKINLICKTCVIWCHYHDIHVCNDKNEIRRWWQIALYGRMRKSSS